MWFDGKLKLFVFCKTFWFIQKQEGKRQLFRLGQYFQRRYHSLLGNEYSRDKVYILSTDHDRAIMSAQVNAAGEKIELFLWSLLNTVGVKWMHKSEW